MALYIKTSTLNYTQKPIGASGDSGALELHAFVDSARSEGRLLPSAPSAASGCSSRRAVPHKAHCVT